MIREFGFNFRYESTDEDECANTVDALTEALLQAVADLRECWNDKLREAEALKAERDAALRALKNAEADRDALHEHVAQLCELCGDRREDTPCDTWRLAENVQRMMRECNAAMARAEDTRRIGLGNGRVHVTIGYSGGYPWLMFSRETENSYPVGYKHSPEEAASIIPKTLAPEDHGKYVAAMVRLPSVETINVLRWALDAAEQYLARAEAAQAEEDAAND